MSADYERLVLAAAQGDAEAYGELVNETSNLVSSIALACVRDLELSRDVAQDVFLSVWRDLKNLRNPASFLPWLRQTTRNRAHAALRSVVRGRRLGETGLLDDLLPQIVDPRPNAAEALASHQEARELAEALESLPEDTREILTLFYRESQSVAQVALLLDLSETAVKKRLSRARERLRQSVSERIGENLCRTRMDASFTAVVLAALPAASAPAAGGAGLAVSKAAGLGLLKLLAPASGFLAGALGGVAGVVLGSRRWLRDARDREEVRALRRHRLVSVAAVLFWAAALPVSFLLTHNRLVVVAWFLCLLATLAVLEHVWRPRIVQRRMEAEMLADPEAAGARRRIERRAAVLGWTLGIGFGSMGLAIGLWFAK
ncbi:MAG TPA: sigma-70 family RNA polymerase sigma factor [Bryobacteraceae bacterium]|nr:sigma-70 family RNA polymerase sigma factor [Bryobacteraceae bacterium]